jgi:hypothetical protein
MYGHADNIRLTSCLFSMQMWHIFAYSSSTRNTTRETLVGSTNGIPQALVRNGHAWVLKETYCLCKQELEWQT